MYARRVFIVGCHRSGTTLMRLILDSHKEICCFDEWKSYKIIENGDYPDFKGLLGFKIPNWTELLVDVDDYRKYYNDDFIIFMMRDVRAVIASMLSLPTGKGNWFKGLIEKMEKEWPYNKNKRKFFELYGDEYRKGDDYKKAALYWKYKTSRYLEMVKLGWKVLPINYEGLVHSPRSYLTIISDFLELEWDENVLNHHQVVHDEVYNGFAVGNSQVFRQIDEISVVNWHNVLSKEQEKVVLETVAEWNDFVSILR